MEDNELESSPDVFSQWFADERGTQVDIEEDTDEVDFDTMDDIDE